MDSWGQLVGEVGDTSGPGAVFRAPAVRACAGDRRARSVAFSACEPVNWGAAAHSGAAAWHRRRTRHLGVSA